MPGGGSERVAVVICAYTTKRWALTRRAVESVRAQTAPVERVVLCIDNNEELLGWARAEWAEADGVPVEVVANRTADHLSEVGAHQAAHGTARRFGAGSARNTAWEAIGPDVADIIAFIDDDAEARPDWIEQLLRVFADPGVVAVGGPPLPDYETGRPDWYPANFDWVFGCAYEGLPTETRPLRHLIGANMSVRRDALAAVGGFLGSDFDDLNLCLRLAERYGTDSILYTPHAVVYHHVPAERVTWRYFWRRCYFVNREKVGVLRQVGSASNLVAEREFVRRALTRQASSDIRRAVGGEPEALRTLGAMVTGIALAGAGNLRGNADRLAQRRPTGPERKSRV
jgi:glucosyl-dolichyl phosphate glucuronosyltransferase